MVERERKRNKSDEMSMKAKNDQLEMLLFKVQNEPLNDKLAKKLLDCFHEGADTLKLLPLIHSPDLRVAEIGTWIASEMGIAAKPIINEIVSLFSKGSRGISFEALDCLTSCVSPNNPDLILEGLRQLSNNDSTVVWKAQMFLSSLSGDSISAAKKYASQLGNEERQIKGLSLLQLSKSSAEQVLASLESSDQLLRAYAAVASVKLSKLDSEPITKALKAKDEIITEFVKSAIKLGIANFTLH
jgi:hypothetical protein